MNPIQPVNPKELQPAPELLAVQDLMPISQDDRENLKADIKKNGVRDALKVYMNEDFNYFILCGVNRWEISLELNFPTIPIEIVDIPKEQREELAINDNVNRRHLTREQKAKLIERFLKKTPNVSDREIAKKTKTDHKTVGRAREKMVSVGEIPQQEKVTGKDGKTYKKKKPVKNNGDIKELKPADKNTIQETINFTLSEAENFSFILAIIENNKIIKKKFTKRDQEILDKLNKQFGKYRKIK